MGALFQLLGYRIISNYRACDKLREHTDVCAVVDETAFRRCFFPVNVNYVGHVLERVEADTYGEDYIFQRKVCAEENIDILRTESPVFEEYQPPEIESDAEYQPRLFIFRCILYELPDDEVEHIRQQEKNDINGLFHAHAVKNDTSEKDHKIFHFDAAYFLQPRTFSQCRGSQRRCSGIYYKKNRQKYEDKLQTAEYQIRSPFVQMLSTLCIYNYN